MVVYGSYAYRTRHAPSPLLLDASYAVLNFQRSVDILGEDFITPRLLFEDLAKARFMQTL
jgi:hypothetical protein